ncbi:MAG: hypothetical protein PHT72_00710 [Candidatus Absconditabacteria bacterium]|nr:hypothetical protein [Candidatus Absconditabacteria bacterium]
MMYKYALSLVFSAIMMTLFYGISPSVSAYFPLSFHHDQTSLTKKKDSSCKQHIPSMTAESTVLSDSEQHPVRAKCPPRKVSNPLLDEEKLALLSRLKEELDKAANFGEDFSDFFSSLFSQDFSSDSSLGVVKEELDWEVERGIITQEQADLVIEKLVTNGFVQELDDLQAKILLEAEKAEAINLVQSQIVEGFQQGILDASQADEMLINLEKGILDLEEGGLVFDLKEEIA